MVKAEMSEETILVTFWSVALGLPKNPKESAFMQGDLL
jgi:hypothetical protein